MPKLNIKYFVVSQPNEPVRVLIRWSTGFFIQIVLESFEDAAACVVLLCVGIIGIEVDADHIPGLVGFGRGLGDVLHSNYKIHVLSLVF